MFEFLTESGIDSDGELTFDIEHEVPPKAGRLVSFTAGNENPHRLTLVRSGTRYVLSFWFTCDRRMEFENFLDGDAHASYKSRGEL